MSTRLDYSKAVLLGLGINPNLLHVGARRAIVAWAGAEDGWHAKLDGVDGARFNLLNTSLVVSDCTESTPYNSIPVQNYFGFACGVRATVLTLQESRYEAVVGALAKPFTTGVTVLNRVAESDWGTFRKADGSPDYEQVVAIYNTYIVNRYVFNAVVVGS